MDFPAFENLATWPVGIYLAGVVLAQIALSYWRRWQEQGVANQRREAGLDDQILVDHAVQLKTLQRHSAIDAVVLLASLVLLPIFLAQVFNEAKEGLGMTFFALVIWTLVSATDVAKAFLGGVAFRAFVGFRRPFQVGDRVTLNGYSGKVQEIGPFFVRLVTLDDDLVSIPTSSLWSAPIVSANAGDRASLCVMTFHLAPFVTAEKRKYTEDAIWDAIQRSVYWDFDKPMQIYLEQHADEILLTARAYVASTYNEALLKSDVYQRFLDYVDEAQVPLASAEWRRDVS